MNQKIKSDRMDSIRLIEYLSDYNHYRKLLMKEDDWDYPNLQYNSIYWIIRSINMIDKILYRNYRILNLTYAE